MAQTDTQRASTAERKAAQSSGQSSPGPRREVQGRNAALENGQGRTTVADSVVTKIASIAAREVAGVRELGGGTARAFGSLRERIPGSGGPSTSQGVSVEVGEKQTALDLVVVIEYGVPIAEVARGVRRNVINSVQNMTGLEVVEVNLTVVDIYIPGEEPETSDTTRVE